MTGRRLLNALLFPALLLIATQASAQNSWQTISNEQLPRSEATVVEYGGDIWILNGFTFGIRLQAPIERYNVAENRWTRLGNTDASHQVGTGVTHNGFVVVDDELWIIGGRIGNHPGRVSDKVWIYGFETNTWRPGPTLPMPFASGGAARLGNRIHVFGGLDANARCEISAHHVYDLNNPQQGWQRLERSAELPMPRNHFSTAVLDGEMYAIGGQYGHDVCPTTPGRPQLALVHRFNPDTNSWQRLSDLPGPQSHTESGTFVHGGRIYMVGGVVDGRHVLVYDPSADRWQRRESLQLTQRLLAPGARIIGDWLYVFGGGAPNVSSPIRATQRIALPAIDRVDNAGGASDGSNGNDSGNNDNSDDSDQDTRASSYRINVGGPSVTDASGARWSADAQSGTAEHGVSGSSIFATTASPSATTDSAVRQVPLDVFKSSRWTGNRQQGLAWSFPVEPGDYDVHLYFAEIWQGAFRSGVRRFDVLLEQQLVEDDLDIFDEAGARQGLVKSYRVSSDEHLSIRLRHVAQNPTLNAIEIVRIDSSDAEQDSDAGSDSGDGTGGNDGNGSDSDSGSGSGSGSGGSGTDADGASDDLETPADLEISSLEIDFGDVSVGEPRLRTITLVNPSAREIRLREIVLGGIDAARFRLVDSLPAGIAANARVSLQLEFVASEAGNFEAILSIAHDGTSMVNLIELTATSFDTDGSIESGLARVMVRMNVGGPALDSVDGLPWQADLDANPIDSITTDSRLFTTSHAVTLDPVAASLQLPPALFQTARWNGRRQQGLGWRFPLMAGEYKLRLYYAETWPGAFGDGRRVFDVWIDGALRSDDVDIHAVAGPRRTYVQSYDVTTDQDTLDVSLRHVTENPTLMGIEILECLVTCSDLP